MLFQPICLTEFEIASNLILHAAPYTGPPASTILRRPHSDHYHLCTIFKSTHECQTLILWQQYKGTLEDKETEALLDHLIANKTLGQGNGSFKDQVYTSAAEAISDLLSSGPVKTSKTCKTKWTTVIVLFIFPYHHLLIVGVNQQLKGIYTAIEDFRTNISGAHWDAVTGVTIEGPMAEKVWNDIVVARVC